MAVRLSSARAGPKPTRSSPRQTAKCPSTPTTCSSLRWPAHELGQDHRVTRSTAEQFIKVLATLQALGASFGTPQRRTRPTVSGDLDPSEPVVVMMCIGRAWVRCRACVVKRAGTLRVTRSMMDSSTRCRRLRFGRYAREARRCSPATAVPTRLIISVRSSRDPTHPKRPARSTRAVRYLDLGTHMPMHVAR